MANIIFDLDHTVIDSSHRQNTLPDGSLDLEHWLENNTPERIMRDSLLPMARAMRALFRLGGNRIIVCTARSYQIADENFLAKHRLGYHAYLSRGAMTICNKTGKRLSADMRGDAQLKRELLEDYFCKQIGYASIADANAIMFDDNHKVINEMRNLGIKCYDAKEINARLSGKINLRSAA